MRLGIPGTALTVTVAAFVLVVLYGPVALVVLASFFPIRQGQVDWAAFSLESYVRLAGNAGIVEAVGNTLLVGASAVLTACLLGTFLAFYAQRLRPGVRNLLQAMIFVPFLLPPILTGLSLLVWFRELGVTRSLLTVAVGHTLLVLALVYRTVLVRLQSLGPRLVEASLDLGATPAQTFRHVLLPNLASALAGAAVLAFALSFDETIVTLLVTGTSNTLPIRLWGMMRMGFTPDINALVALVLAFTTLVCLLAARLLAPRDAS